MGRTMSLKRTRSGIATGACLVLAATAAMAEEPRGSLKDSRSYDRPFSWTGFYVGGSIGAGQLESDHLVSLDGLGFLNPPNASVRDTNFLGGVVLGYDWQVGNFVYGVAVDLSAGNLQGLTIQEGDDGFETRIKSFGTARLNRAPLAFCSST
jgi:hypothetical protein